jgi:hypothetical protein
MKKILEFQREYTKEEVATALRVMDLKAKKVHPKGKFLRNGCWIPSVETESSLKVRDPSVRFPYSKLAHCRTAIYNCQLDGTDPRRVNQIIAAIRRAETMRIQA